MNLSKSFNFIKKNRAFSSLVLLSLVFFFLVIFDFLPFLRGPAPYPPEWQWPYFFVNTIDKIYAPVLVFAVFLFIFFKSENKKSILSKKTFILPLIIVGFSILIQLSVLYFSRAGINVLLGRIINPEINGYFTASTGVKNIYDFLNTYNSQILSFVYHAKAHPPGAILIFYLIKQIIAPFSNLFPSVDNLNLTHEKINLIWQGLSKADKLTALVSPFAIILISSLSVIPTYLASKLIYGGKTAKRSIFLLLLVPTLVFFVPINDTFLQIFSITSFYFLLKGLKSLNYSYFIASGLMLFLGVFFNLSLLPVAIILFLFALFYLLRKQLLNFKFAILASLSFAFGLLSPLIFLKLTFNFDFIKMVQIIMANVPDIHTRSYTLWIYYNLQDFLIFSGIPVTISFLTLSFENIKSVFTKTLNNLDIFSFSLLLMLLILDFSGSVRGETGRLWSPYAPFIVMSASYYLTEKLRLNRRFFAVILLLMFLQLLVMQEFWVMLW